MEAREKAKRAIETIWQRREAVVELTVHGWSMRQSLPDGSRVFVHFSKRPQLTKQAIIYFRRGRQRIAHRLLFTIGPFCIEKGDSNPWPLVVLARNVIGNVLEGTP